MDLDDLQRLVAGGESETLEFKKTTGQLSRAGKTLCGFLNGRGGIVLFGVEPDGKVTGQLVSDTTLRDIASLFQMFEPQPPITVRRIILPGTRLEVISLEAESRTDLVPFSLEGRAYQRIGTTDSVMPQQRYQELLLNRMHSRNRWENQPAREFGLSDLDDDEIQRTARLGISSGRMPETTGFDSIEVLDRLGLRVDGQLLNAAIVVFGRRPLPQFPQCQLRMARFRGIDKTEFEDQRQLHGHAFLLLEEAILFLRRHLPAAGRIQPGLFERADEPLFPFEALREALVNAFCHRDYSSSGGAVSLAVYDDRLEIWSDGTLPFGLTIEDLRREHLSRPRNPLIAEAFFRRGLIERWGRGTQKIVELCTRAGHPEPEFLEQNGTVGVRFVPLGYTAPLRVSSDLTPRQREILQLLAGRGATPLREIRDGLVAPPADRTLQDDLSHLKRLGLIGSGGRGRGAAYWLRSIR
ncbi:MAG TPA: ATP-binding protein [Thermoanaerobaculia bacterium]|nr:ATP-binding protein [Thermoanaerobaculia bacterium]